MSIYAIGDIQGCFTAFQNLLSHIQFSPTKDTLWFTGDLVNRGSQSLEVLRFIKSLGEKHITILGNHDLHLLSVAYDVGRVFAKDTLKPVLDAPDCKELIEWLRMRPLLHYDKERNVIVTHAGLAPCWSLNEAEHLAREVEVVLQSDTPEVLLKALYGNEPSLWDNELKGLERLRCIINYLTRMRYCYPDGRLELTFKGAIKDKPNDLIPWFAMPNRKNTDVKIIFGHWASLGGKADVPDVYPLDTGCVWGNCLTAMRIDDEKRFKVNCQGEI